MGDSDEDYDRRRGRDKFRRERNDNYERRDDRRRENWDDRGGRENWGRRDNRQGYGGRDYDRGNRRERFSPGRHDISPPQKRMRRDWDSGPGGGFSHFNEGGPYGGGGHMHGPHGNDWNGPSDMPPPPQHHFGERGPGDRGRSDMDFPTQPPMQTFKQFLSSQDDNISDDDAIKKFNEYKVEFKRQQINEFFLAHKDEEWFKAKYHPEECGKRKEDAKKSLLRRRDIFMKLTTDIKWMDGLSVSQEKQEQLVRLLDAAVILMEGGTDFDLQVLDQTEENIRSRNDSESQPSERRLTEEAPGSAEEGEEGEDMSGKPEKKMNREQDEMLKTNDFSEKNRDEQKNGQELKKKKVPTATLR